jgi:CheY-like chemotaxis protein
MTQLSQGPQALIIGANNELCMAAEQMIQLHTGSKSMVVTSARGAFQSVTKQNPIELIMVVDRVHDMSLFELLQRLRNSGSLPIAVLVERLYQHEQDFIQKGAGFYTSTLSRDPDQMKQVIDQLTRTLDVRPMTSDDRIRFTSLAASFLTKISADRNTYAFYPVSEWHEQMVSLPAVVRPQAQSQLLSGLGSKESQRKLTAMASTSGVSEQDRFAAARSFETSVRQFGMLLSDQEIKGTYELYNRLGPNDPAIAKAMGYILDIIEARAGSRLWPDPL